MEGGIHRKREPWEWNHEGQSREGGIIKRGSYREVEKGTMLRETMGKGNNGKVET